MTAHVHKTWAQSFCRGPKLTQPLENTRLRNKPEHAPVETHGPGSLVQDILEFFVDLDFKQA